MIGHEIVDSPDIEIRTNIPRKINEQLDVFHGAIRQRDIIDNHHLIIGKNRPCNFECHVRSIILQP